MTYYQPSPEEVWNVTRVQAEALGIDPATAMMAVAFRADPDGCAVVMTDMFRRLNRGLELGFILTVGVTALATWLICKDK